jgi:prepilin-type N-terminal cleavage/methylation domain-containing protein
MDRQTPIDRSWWRWSWVLGLGSWVYPRPRPKCQRPGCTLTDTRNCRAASTGFSLIELMVTVTVIGILVTMTVPFYQRAIQQSRANVAATNLRAIWAAQRMYWIEFQVYASDLSTLKTQKTLDSNLDNSDTAFTYSSTTSSDYLHFQATATPKSGTWTGQYTLDETGKIDGAIHPPGWSEAILPPEFP